MLSGRLPRGRCSSLVGLILPELWVEKPLAFPWRFRCGGSIFSVKANETASRAQLAVILSPVGGDRDLLPHASGVGDISRLHPPETLGAAFRTRIYPS